MTSFMEYETLKIESILIWKVFPAFASLQLDAAEADVVRGLRVGAVVPGLTVWNPNIN